MSLYSRKFDLVPEEEGTNGGDSVNSTGREEETSKGGDWRWGFSFDIIREEEKGEVGDRCELRRAESKVK